MKIKNNYKEDYYKEDYIKNYKENYIEELSKIELTEIQKQKIINTLNLNNKNKIRPTRLRKLIVVGSVIGVLSVTAYATEIFKLTDSTINFLKPHGSEQLEELSLGASAINKSDTEKSGTILIKEVIGSDYQTFIFFDFIAPEGTILDENKIYRFVEYSQKVFTDDRNEQFYRYDYIESEINDNIISFCYQITTPDGSLDGKKIELTFQDLKIASDEETYLEFYDEAMTLINIDNKFEFKELRDTLNKEELLNRYNIQNFQGDWKIKFDANFSKYTEKNVFKDLYVLVDELEAKIESVDVSPISIAFEMTANIGEHIDENTFKKLRSFNIYYKDGSVVPINDVGGTYSILTNEIFIFSTFTSVINEKDIDYIDYHGAKIYVNK